MVRKSEASGQVRGGSAVGGRAREAASAGARKPAEAGRLAGGLEAARTYGRVSEVSRNQSKASDEALRGGSTRGGPEAQGG